MMKLFLRGLAIGPLAEPLMGLTMLMIGVALLLPNDTFAMSNYATLAAIARENVWGVAMIALGAAQMWAGLLDLRIARLVTCTLSGAVWMFWTAATLHSGYRGIVWAVGLAMIAGELIAYLRALAART